MLVQVIGIRFEKNTFLHSLREVKCLQGYSKIGGGIPHYVHTSRLKWAFDSSDPTENRIWRIGVRTLALERYWHLPNDVVTGERFRKRKNVPWWPLEGGVLVTWWKTSLKKLLIWEELWALDIVQTGEKKYTVFLNGERSNIFSTVLSFSILFDVHLMVVFRNAKW